MGWETKDSGSITALEPFGGEMIPKKAIPELELYRDEEDRDRQPV